MAINTNAPYSGEVEYGTVGGAAPGDVVNGGSLTVDPQVSTVDGIGMVRVSYSSYYTGAVSYDVTYPVVTALSGMIRSSATSSVAAVACIAGNQDGEWTLSASQPSGFTARSAVGEALTANLGYWGIPAQTATGGSQSQGGGVDAEACDFTVTVDAVDYYAQSFEIAVNSNPYWFDAMNTTGSRAPTAVLLGTQDVTLQLSCAKQIPDSAASYTAANHDSDIDVVISASGLVTFTLSNLGTPVETGSHQVGALKVYDYSFPACVQLGALTIAAS